MSVSVSTEVYGIKSAIKELKKIDPELRKQINKDAKEIAQPIISAAKSNYPVAYLSGMKYGWAQKGRVKFPYDQQKAIKGIVVKVDTAKKNKGTIVVMQKDPAAAIIDMAGKKGGNGVRGENFVKLMSRFGKPSRVMWPAYEAHAPEVLANMEQLVEAVMEAVHRNIVAI